jgi:hypothetical protein
MTHGPLYDRPVGIEMLHSTRRSQVIESVRSPIGFFTLSLLIVEAFLFGSGIFLPPALKVVAFVTGIALFLLVFGIVVWLVIRYPTNLIFGERTQLEYQRMQIYGQNGAPLYGAELKTLSVVPAPPVIEERQLGAEEKGGQENEL